MSRRLLPCVAVGLAALVWHGESRADVTRAQCVDTYERSQVLRRDTKLREAREALLVCSQRQCPSVTINDCARWLAEVEALLPSISVAVRDSVGTDLRATISVDGKEQPSTSAGQTIPLDPGSHHVRAETGDGRVAELDVVARAGEQSRLVTLTVADRAAASKPTAPAVTPDPHAKEQASRSVAVPVAVTAVGVLGIGAALYFGLHASSQADDLRRSSCAPYCPSSSLDGVHRNLVLSDIGLGVGVVGLAVGTYLWVLFASHGTKGEAATAARGTLYGGPLATF